MASGGAMTLTREPSGRRASHIGLEFIDAAADLADDALADIHQLLIVGEANAGLLHLAADFDEGRVGAIDHDVGDVVASQQRLERPIAQNVVADVFEQLFLLGDRHHDVLDLNDLADDVADFFARSDAVELRELGQIDRIDQRVEDGRFDVVVFFRMLALRFNDGLRTRRLQRQPAAVAAATRPAAPQVPSAPEAQAIAARRALAATGSFERLPNMMRCP